MEKIVKEIASLASNGLNVGALSETPAILKRDDFDIQSLEYLMQNPLRIRQHLTVNTAQSLIDYVNKFRGCSRLASMLYYKNEDNSL